MNALPLRRAAIALGLCLIAACSRGAGQKPQSSTEASPNAAIVYPLGVIPPADWYGQTHNGIYAGDSRKQCCFLAGHATLTLDNPPGAERAVFTFYVPDVKPLRDKHERVSLSFNGVRAGDPAELPPGTQNVIFTIPASVRGTRHLTVSLTMSITWVPKRIGLNGDARELSIMLTQVGYI